MSDIFREVEEDVRRERAQQFWKQYRDFIIAGVALVVIAVAGQQLWRYYDARERARASSAYVAAQSLLETGQIAKASDALAALAKDSPSGYAELAKLQRAGALQATGKRDEAIALYKSVIADGDSLLADVARVRLGWALVDTKPRSELETLLAPLTDPASAWRGAAGEILAYSSYRSGDFKRALGEYKALKDDKEAPPATRYRADLMAQFLEAGGSQNYGIVPPEASVPAPGAAPQQPPAPPPAQPGTTP